MPTNKTLPVAHSTINADNLGDLLIESFDIGRSLVCELLHRGMNDFYLVRTKKKNYVCQVWRPGIKTINMLDRQMDFLKYLYEGGVKVPLPIKTTSNDWTFSFESHNGIRHACVFDFVKGKVFSKDPRVLVSKEMGNIFGKIHNLSEKFKLKKNDKRINREVNILSGFSALEKILMHRNDDLVFYKRLSLDLENIYRDAYIDKDLKLGMTHGDFHIHNAFVRSDKDITIMDFDGCGIDFFAQELMSYKWSIEKNSLSMSLWDNFLIGYDEVRTISKKELDYFPVFLIGKELSYLCGFANAINAIGHVSFHFPGLSWFAKSLRNHAKIANLI